MREEGQGGALRNIPQAEREGKPRKAREEKEPDAEGKPGERGRTGATGEHLEIMGHGSWCQSQGSGGDFGEIAVVVGQATEAGTVPPLCQERMGGCCEHG